MILPISLLISLFFIAFIISFATEVVSIFRNTEGFKAEWNEKDRRWNNFIYPFFIQTVVIFLVLFLIWYVTIR